MGIEEKGMVIGEKGMGTHSYREGNRNWEVGLWEKSGYFGEGLKKCLIIA